MLYLSIIDNNSNLRSEIIEECTRILFNLDFSVKEYCSIDELIEDQNCLNNLEILIINDFFINLDELTKMNKIKKEHKKINIMFYGNDINLIPMAYEVEHFYFILTSQMKNKLGPALQKGINLLNKYNKRCVKLDFQSKVDIVPVNDIIQIQSSNRRLKIITTTNEYYTYSSLDEIIGSNSKELFFRINYGGFVNSMYVKAYRRDTLFLKNGIELPISRNYISNVRNHIQNNNYYFNSIKKIKSFRDYCN